MSNRTKAIFVDSKQHIWIGLEKGVCLYNSDLDRFELVEHNEDINPALINVITEDKNNTIWVGAFNGLWKSERSPKKL